MQAKLVNFCLHLCTLITDPDKRSACCVHNIILLINSLHTEKDFDNGDVWPPENKLISFKNGNLMSGNNLLTLP